MKGIRKRPGQIIRSPRGTIMGGKSEQSFGVPINLPKVAPRESMEHYWHPNRAGVEMAPEDFARKLTEMNADLRCCRAPANAPITGGSAWVLWYQRGRVTHPLCPGWLLLFSWRNAETGAPEPLDERVFAVLYGSSAMKYGSGAEYFKRAVEEKMRDAKLSRDRAFQNHRKAKQREFSDSRKISTAGNGSKFAAHHDGTVAPSRGQLDWHRERRRHILPPDMIAAEDDARERSRALQADLDQALRKVR